MAEIIVCTPRRLPQEGLISLARTAVGMNRLNRPPLHRLTRVQSGFHPTPERIALVTTKYWGIGGARLTVGFMDNPPADLRKRILQHMNAWSARANVKFSETRTDPQVRIAREGGERGGYWSYVGTDILHVPTNEPTMNLEEFTLSTPESEYCRVVRHETGHTLGLPHEHLRRALVDKIDPAKAIAFFQRTQGWPEEQVRQQVLTPIEEASLLAIKPKPNSNSNSIMCYQIAGELTKDGKPIIAGKDILASDASLAGMIYPKKVTPVKKSNRTTV